MSVVDAGPLCEIAQREFSDLVLDVLVPDMNELRILLCDGSFVDVWFSLKLAGRYSYHWERTAIDGTIYRHDNAPHHRWRALPTFPPHFDGAEARVVASDISEDPPKALREFLTFVRAELERSSSGSKCTH